MRDQAKIAYLFGIWRANGGGRLMPVTTEAIPRLSAYENRSGGLSIVIDLSEMWRDTFLWRPQVRRIIGERSCMHKAYRVIVTAAERTQ